MGLERHERRRPLREVGAQTLEPRHEITSMLLLITCHLSISHASQLRDLWTDNTSSHRIVLQRSDRHGQAQASRSHAL